MVLMSSHLLNEVGATADDIVIINAGRLVKQARMAELGIAEATSRVRVSHYDRAEARDRGAGRLVSSAAPTSTAPFLRVRTQDLYVIGAALFNANVAVFELTREPYDLEEQFFAMLEGPA